MERSLTPRYFGMPWIGLALCCLLSTPLRAELFSMELQREGRQAERLSTIRQLDGPPGSVLRIASEAGTDFEFTLDRVLRRRSGIKVFSGIAENGARLALVTTPEGALEGSVRDGVNRYRLYEKNGEMVWQFVDQSLARPIESDSARRARASAEQLMKPTTLPRLQPRATRLAQESVSYPVYQTGTATIRLLYYYDQALSNGEAVAQLVTELSNQAMADSNVDIVFEVPEGAVKPVTVDTSLLLEETLDQMDAADAPFSNIVQDRATYQADLIVLLRKNTPAAEDSCGLAPVGVVDGIPYRFAHNTVVKWLPFGESNGDFCTESTTPHELGHMLGSLHERRISDGGGAYDFSYGYYRTGRFKTIMSYGRESEELVFSNPNLRDCGEGGVYLCGSPAGTSGSADNARGFNQIRFMVEGYEGDAFRHETWSDFRIDQNCTQTDGSSGVRRGHGFGNSSPFDVEVRAFSVLNDTEEVFTTDYELGEAVYTPGLYTVPCEHPDAN